MTIILSLVGGVAIGLLYFRLRGEL